MWTIPTVKLRTFLIGLVAATLLPVVALAGYLSFLSALSQRASIERGMRETARALSFAEDGQAAAAMAGLDGLVASPEFRNGDYAAFRTTAEKFLKTHEGWLSVVDEDGQQHLNTRLPADSPLPRTDNVEWLHSVFTAKPFFVTGAVTGPVVNIPFVAISRRVTPTTGRAVALTWSISPDSLSRILLAQGLPTGWYGVLADRSGVIIARTQGQELIGQPMTVMPTPPNGFVSATTHEGEDVYLAWSTSALTGWSTGVAAPAHIIDGPLRSAISKTVLLCVLAVMLAVITAVTFGRLLTRPLAALVQGVRESTPGAPRWRPGQSALVEIETLATAFREKIDELFQAIAGRDAAQADLEKLNAELEARVRERSAELQRVSDHLMQTQKQESLGRLSGGIAHDFNNLLTAVLGNLELLAKRLSGEDALKYVANARRAAERGAELTSQLLAFSRRQHLEPKPIDVNEAARNMAQLFRSTFGGNIRIDLALAPEVGPALADPTQLELVILNLAINSRDAMPMGGTLTIETYCKRVDQAGDGPEAPKPGDYVVVAMSDTGFGMTEEVRARAFEPFFTTKDLGKGSGLGLPHVLGVTKQLGGGLRIHTGVGVGTRVEVYLPRWAGAVEETSAVRAHSAANLQGLHVLLVDDDPDVRAVTALMLRELGCTVSEVTSGAAAVELVGRRGVDIGLAIIDFAMPGVDGIETARRISQVRGDVPVLLITGYADTDRLEQSWKGPMLKKPFATAELSAAIAAMLSPSDNVVLLRKA
jgi:signal transduction histidine kinase